MTTSLLRPPGAGPTNGPDARPPADRRTGSSVAGWRLPRGGPHGRPAGAVAAGMLIVAGAALGSVTVVRSGHRTAVWEIVGRVPAGHPISLADLRPAEIAAPTDVVVPTSVAVVGATAAVDLLPGTLLSRSALGGTALPGPGQATVGIPLRAGAVPSGVSAGDRVDVIAAAPVGSAATAAQGGRGAVLAAGVVVLAVRPDAADGYVVTLVTDRSTAAALAAVASGGGLALTRIGG